MTITHFSRRRTVGCYDLHIIWVLSLLSCAAAPDRIAWLNIWGTFRCLSPVSYHIRDHTHKQTQVTIYTNSHVECTTDDALCCVRRYRSELVTFEKTVSKQCKVNIVLYVGKSVFKEGFDTRLMIFFFLPIHPCKVPYKYRLDVPEEWKHEILN